MHWLDELEGILSAEGSNTVRLRVLREFHARHRAKHQPTNEEIMAAIDDLRSQLTTLATNVGALADKVNQPNPAQAVLDAQNDTLATFADGVKTINDRVAGILNPPTPPATEPDAQPAPAPEEATAPVDQVAQPAAA